MNTRLMKKGKIVLFVIVVVISTFIFIVLKYPKAKPTTFLIPMSYRGEVLVVYNQLNGLPIEYESTRRIYRIPINGVLFTQFEYNPGHVDEKYYFIDSVGNRIEIEYRPFMDERDRSIFQPEKVGITRHIAHFYGTDSCILKTSQLVVCNHNDYGKYNCYLRMNKIADSLCNSFK